MCQHSPSNGGKYQINRVNAILSMNRALLGAVFPGLRAAQIKRDEKKILIYFYHHGEISEEDRESAECAATEAIADFPEHTLEVNILRWDYPKPIPAEGDLVFKRRESKPF